MGGDPVLIKCGECKAVLVDETPGVLCPDCGSDRRDIFIGAKTVTVDFVAAPPGIAIGFSDARSWTEQWSDVRHSYAKLQGLYQTTDNVQNDEVRRVVKEFFVRCWHVWDWLMCDPNVPITEAILKAFYQGNTSLTCCNAMANASKHHTRNSGTTAVVKAVNFGKTITVDIATANPAGIIDALKLATDCMSQWRTLLAANNVAEP
jgi:uncharacterized Zn finger protein (UPF0148 family)